jgi:hypothetical protein
MSNKTYGILLIVVGVLIVVFVFVAAPLHLAGEGFGLKKIAALVVGVIALAAGLYLSLAKKPAK